MGCTRPLELLKKSISILLLCYLGKPLQENYLVMLGTTVFIPSTLVPQMGGGNVMISFLIRTQSSFSVQEEKAKMIQTLLFVSGLNTLTQTLFGTRLSAVIGGSFTFVPTTISIVLAGRYNDMADPLERFQKITRGIQGSMIVASPLQIVIGFSGLWQNVTSGYMSPESAISGHFSVKSDVFSFGVIVLEIISGRTNRGFYQPEHDYNLIGHTWKLWNEGNYLELVNKILDRSYSASEVMRCIQVALLCVQQRVDQRPTVCSVVFMLES